MEFWLRKYSATAGTSGAITMLYTVNVLDSIGFQYNSPISPSPLPEEGGDENILVKIMGNTNTLSLSWVIKEETANKGETNSSVSGLYSGSSKTVLEQLKWFTDSDKGFIGTGIADSFDFVIVENGSHSGDKFSDEISGLSDNESQRKGFVRNLSFNTSGSEPVTLKASMDFIEGNTITGYNGNTPSTPRNFVVQKGDASGNDKDTKMYLTWTLPAKNGGSAFTVNSVFKRLSNGGEWVVYTGNGAMQAAILTGLTAGTSYDFKVATSNANGIGSYTYIRSKTTDT